jgi:hypothetical protein
MVLVGRTWNGLTMMNVASAGKCPIAVRTARVLEVAVGQAAFRVTQVYRLSRSMVFDIFSIISRSFLPRAGSRKVDSRGSDALLAVEFCGLLFRSRIVTKSFSYLEMSDTGGATGTLGEPPGMVPETPLGDPYEPGTGADDSAVTSLSPALADHGEGHVP